MAEQQEKTKQEEKQTLIQKIMGFFKGAKIQAVQDGEVLDDEQLNSIAETKEWDDVYDQIKGKSNAGQSESETPEPQTAPQETAAENQNSNNSSNHTEQNPTQEMATPEEINALIDAKISPLQSKISELEKEKIQLAQELEAANKEKQQIEQQRGLDKSAIIEQSDNVQGFKKTGLDKTNGMTSPSEQKNTQFLVGKYTFHQNVYEELEADPQFDSVAESAKKVIGEVQPLSKLPALVKK